MIDNSFHIITFGCQMNVHDSQWLARALEARGFCEAPLEEARVVVVNTCSVREKPEQKVMSTLGRIRQVTGNSPRVLVAVTGCVAQQLGEKLFSRQVRLVAGSDGISGAPQAIERLLDEPALRLSLLDFTSHYVEREPGADTPSAPVGFVNIMQGCDNFCAYCIVPYTRGRQKSRLTPAILDECRHLLDRGAREITLLGQNVNAFGRDTHGDGVSFAALLEKVSGLRARYEADMEAYAFQNALADVFEVIDNANKYIDATAPWVLAKSEDTKPRLARVLYNLAETLRICTVLLQPFMPATCEKIFAQLGVDDSLKTWDSAAAVGSMPANATLHKGENIFPRIDTAKELAELDALEAAQKAAAQAANAPAEEPKAEAAAASAELIGDHEEEISFDDFCKVELRVAEVRACERMKESKKLLHLTVFDGERERCILSGIAKWFAPEDLIGKKIGIVANLAPRPMMKGKYVSEGMIFAADTDVDGGCSIAFFPDSTPAGARIH